MKKRITTVLTATTALMVLAGPAAFAGTAYM